MNYLEIAKRSALVAGEEIMKIYQREFKTTIKKDNSPLTEADIRANQIIISFLEKTNIPILSEEKRDDLSRMKSSLLWIIDPIDGTKDFINKTGEFSIMIGLVSEKEPILGVIYQPTTDKLYFAEKGKGSFLQQKNNTKQIFINKEQKIILTSRNHTSDVEYQLIENLGLKDIPCGSIGVKLGLIAEGKAGNYLNLSNKANQWDACGPQIILTEAGGKVTNKKGNEIFYNQEATNLENGLIATNGICHGDIITAINS